MQPLFCKSFLLFTLHPFGFEFATAYQNLLNGNFCIAHAPDSRVVFGDNEGVSQVRMTNSEGCHTHSDGPVRIRLHIAGLCRQTGACV